MKISLIVCTYMRPDSLKQLLNSVGRQSKVPDEILIIDGSSDDKTEKMLQKGNYTELNIRYYRVSEEERGLTKQRNYGIGRVSSDMEIVAFLDDDTELDRDYFREIENTFLEYNDAVGVSGYIVNEVMWERADETNSDFFHFTIDGWSRKEDKRILLRKMLGLITETQPSKIVSFSHERALGGLPPSGKVYEVDFLQGAMMNFKKSVFEHIGFSHYFEGYGLYEDRDFTIRLREYGSLYVNTNAKLSHFHDPLGRPNYITYGKMTVRNGWRVWRVATPNPKFVDVFKWYATTLLLAYARLGAIFYGVDRKKAMEEFIGRHMGLFSLIFNKPPLD